MSKKKGFEDKRETERGGIGKRNSGPLLKIRKLKRIERTSYLTMKKRDLRIGYTIHDEQNYEL